ncbi:MAG: hypothetical protein QOI08_299 [Actinomycetota bacterium]|nr:hypothetical protein [Actinomycetota bacterium]
MSTLLAAAPSPPASLTKPPTIDELRGYLECLAAWRKALDTDLDALDKRAQTSRTPDVYSNDVSLAMALRASIDSRCDDLTRVWDSGRVGSTELARSAQLIWGRLPDALLNPSAFSLTEACTLVAALYARIDARLSVDVVAGSGATDEITALRETLDRCTVSAKTLRRRQDDVAALSARLDMLVGTADPADMAAGVAELTNEAYLLEALLIKEIGLRSAVTRDAAAALATRNRLVVDETKVRALAGQARLKIVDVPTLAIPSVAVVADPPSIPGADVDAEPGAWTAVRAELDAYLAHLTQIDAALKQAGDRYGAGLARRADLRGLLGAYRDRAERSGLAEDDALAAQYQAAHDVLYTAPCDIVVAERVVSAYQQSVLGATRPRAKEEP